MLCGFPLRAMESLFLNVFFLLPDSVSSPFFSISLFLFIGCELTQASNFTDDLILVQMGAVPEGLSAEQKDAFVVGLRQVIQEIRGRKVKDFKTVASEIVAYRARFLGDDFKVLPL